MIPEKIHYLFGLDEKFGNRNFTFFHYLNLLSCIKINNTFDVCVYYFYEPNSFWWNLSKKICRFEKISEIPNNFNGIKITEYAHVADWIRLDILEKFGGVYLDIDVLCVNSLKPLLINTFVMGEEKFNGNRNGLCNAVILSEKNHEFLKAWKNEFKNFDSYDWNKMAVRVPWELSRDIKINIQPSVSFFKYDWHTIVDIFNKDGEISPNMYVIHMWENKIYHSILKHISPETIKDYNSTYNKFVNNL